MGVAACQDRRSGGAADGSVDVPLVIGHALVDDVLVQVRHVGAAGGGAEVGRGQGGQVDFLTYSMGRGTG